MLVEKVFRGRHYGEYDLSKTAYKNDFKLVPRDEEEFYLSRTMKAEELEKLKKSLPEFIQFPPLLKVNTFIFTNMLCFCNIFWKFRK